MNETILELLGLTKLTADSTPAVKHLWLNGVEVSRRSQYAIAPREPDAEGWGLVRLILMDDKGQIIVRDLAPVFVWCFGRVKWSTEAEWVGGKDEGEARRWRNAVILTIIAVVAAVAAVYIGGKGVGW